MNLKKVMLITLLSFILGNFISINTYADNIDSNIEEYNGDLLYSEEDYLPKYYSNNTSNFDVAKLDDLPSKIDLSESSYFPMILKQQGDSCVSWITTYYQFTYEVNKKNNLKKISYSEFIEDIDLVEKMFNEWCEYEELSSSDIEQILKYSSKNEYAYDYYEMQYTLYNCYSPAFVYNYLNRGRSYPTSIKDNYKVLNQCGALLCCDFACNEDYTVWCTDSQKLIDALKIKITDYNDEDAYINSNDTDGKFEEQLYKIKELLSIQEKVVVTSSFSKGWQFIDKSDLIKRERNGEEIKDYVIYECLYDNSVNAKNGAHGITVVGYDDTFWCDVNNNGKQDVGEIGAFKVANSYGKSWKNNGYIWVLYDALRSTSKIPNKEDNTTWSNATSSKQRIPVFTLSNNQTNNVYDGKNIFYYIEDIKEIDTKLVGEVTLKTNYKNQLDLRYNYNQLLPFSKISANNDNDKNEYLFNLPFEGPIIFDFTDNYNSYDSLEEINNVKWKVEIGDTWKDDNYITNINYCLKDNLNNVVATYNGNIEDLDGTSITKEIQLNLIKGDLNYDEEITQEDINILQSYLNDEEELSYLQKDLADINEDGDINTSDLFALLGLDTSSTQQILVDLTQLGTDIDLNFKINISSDKNFNYTLSYNDLETYEQNSNQKILNILYIENTDYQIDLYDGTNYICTINNLNDFINSLGKSDTGTKYFESIGYELNYFPSNGNTYANIILNTYLNGDIDTNGQIQSNDLLKLKRYLLGMYNFIQTGAEDSVLINNEYGNKCNNITINGNLTANGYLKLNSYNGNVNGELNANTFSISEGINHKEVGNDTSSFNSLILTDEEITELYFDVSNNITDNNIINDNIIIDTNLNYESTSKYGDILTIGNYNTQSITINSSIKSNTDIEITGNVKNSHDSIIYSSQGNIIINADNINFNGILYAPNGSVIITGKNVSICGTIIANKIAINSSNVNFNIQSYEDDNHDTLNPIEKLLADINNDKLINIIDLLNLKKYLLGLIEEQKCTLK